MTYILLMLMWFLFIALDLVAYSSASWPERNNWKYKIPGGGFIALWKFGRDK